MADSNVPYLKLITSEHSVQPKYTEYVKTFLDMISPCVDIYNDFAKFCPRKCEVPACNALPSCIIASMQ